MSRVTLIYLVVRMRYTYHPVTLFLTEIDSVAILRQYSCIVRSSLRLLQQCSSEQ